jgi:hypothetical protein
MRAAAFETHAPDFEDEGMTTRRRRQSALYSIPCEIASLLREKPG